MRENASIEGAILKKSVFFFGIVVSPENANFLRVFLLLTFSDSYIPGSPVY